MKAGILSMLEGILKKQRGLGKRATALLKNQVGRFANMILHPNAQLRDKTIAVVELILSSTGGAVNKEVRKAFTESSMLDRMGANMAEVLRHSDALSVASLVSPLVAVARAGGADNASRLTKKMLGVFFEEKRTDSKVGKGISRISKVRCRYAVSIESSVTANTFSLHNHDRCPKCIDDSIP